MIGVFQKYEIFLKKFLSDEQKETDLEKSKSVQNGIEDGAAAYSSPVASLTQR